MWQRKEEDYVRNWKMPSMPILEGTRGQVQARVCRLSTPGGWPLKTMSPGLPYPLEASAGDQRTEGREVKAFLLLLPPWQGLLLVAPFPWLQLFLVLITPFIPSAHSGLRVPVLPTFASPTMPYLFFLFPLIFVNSLFIKPSSKS